jgi:GNAT superfamily N-acetyltransferase
MENQLTFRLMNPGEEENVIDIVSSVFDEFVAPQDSAEGIAEFYKYVNVKTLIERSKINHFTIIAEQSDEVLGVIEIRNDNHISLFFIKRPFQRKGIGRQLLHRVIDVCYRNNPGLQKITVHATPNAVQAYEKMGFVIEDIEQCVNGIKYVPMSLKARPVL